MRPLPLVQLALAALVLVSTGCSQPAAKPSAEQPAAPTAPPAPKVVLISWDGLRPEFYLSSRYEAPTLRKLARSGAYTRAMIAVHPTVTYPNHTSMVTGTYPARHGVFANTIFSFQQGPLKDWYWDYSHIRVPTLWSEARKAGKKTAALGWPVTVGAPIDYNVPEIFNPQDTGPDSWELTRRSSDRALLEQIASESAVKEFRDFPAHDEFMTAGAVSVIRKQGPDLVAVHLGHVDNTQHETGRDSRETREAVKLVDGYLKRILDAVDLRKTTVLVAGDHGFLDYTRTLNINALFAQAGLLKIQGDRITEWKAVAHNSGGQAAIYVIDEAVKPQVLSILKKRSKGRYTVLPASRLADLQAYPEAFCVVDPVDGYSVGGKLDGPFEQPVAGRKGNHGYLPSRTKMFTGFVAAGPGIPAARELGTVSVVDIAPTIAGLLGIALPSAQGRPLELADAPAAGGKLEPARAPRPATQYRR